MDVITETARHREGSVLIGGPAHARPASLLIAHCAGLVADRVRTINQLRDVLTGILTALERALDYSSLLGNWD